MREPGDLKKEKLGTLRSRAYSWSYSGYIGIMEKKMETTIMGYIGFRVLGP